MPNYVSNGLSIKADAETLKRIREEVKSEESAFDFDKIVPMPDYIFKGDLGPKEREQWGENNWYDWSLKNWGTKWNSDDVYVYEYSEELDYDFQTAWSPCIPVIEALARKYSNTTIVYSYIEPNYGFSGANEFENGEEVYHMEADYSDNWECEDTPKGERNYEIEDKLYPVQEDGVFEEKTNVVKIGNAEIGEYHYREYLNGGIRTMVDGRYFDARKGNRTIFCGC